MYHYQHKVQYYETDKMGVTHHSNYIRFMEEARVAWMDAIGCSYKTYEEIGIISPVIAARCTYKKTTTFDDIITVTVRLKEYNGVKLTVEYEMKKEDSIVAVGETEHCFLHKDTGRPVRMKRDYPEQDAQLKNEWEKDKKKE